METQQNGRAAGLDLIIGERGCEKEDQGPAPAGNQPLKLCRGNPHAEDSVTFPFP